MFQADSWHTDDGNCRVQKFGDSNGNFIGEWGRKGSDKGEFKFPKGIAVDVSGYVYVTATKIIVSKSFEAATDNFITAWSSEGSRDGHLTPLWYCS